MLRERRPSLSSSEICTSTINGSSHIYTTIISYLTRSFVDLQIWPLKTNLLSIEVAGVVLRLLLLVSHMVGGDSAMILYESKIQEHWISLATAGTIPVEQENIYNHGEIFWVFFWIFSCSVVNGESKSIGRRERWKVVGDGG
ncbi:unnamed protein product [Lactuca virosa]|uniref:Uncharacterized protein n=1 Tax=Lactuca virosa TaxID=75947 RepID=A0AAU9MKL3_9ASTR|nr:unnamed protein product [Lactuca virosa]